MVNKGESVVLTGDLCFNNSRLILGVKVSVYYFVLCFLNAEDGFL